MLKLNLKAFTLLTLSERYGEESLLKSCEINMAALLVKTQKEKEQNIYHYNYNKTTDCYQL